MTANIKKLIFFHLLIWPLFFAFTQANAARYNNTGSTLARSLMPDGTAVADFVTNPTAVANSSTWFAVQTAANQSYVVELVNTAGLNGINANRFNLEFFDGNGGVFPGVKETSGCNPAAFEFNPPTWRRFAVKVNSTTVNSYLRIKVSNGLNYTPGIDMPFQIRVYDTTLASARWNIKGFNSFVQLHNTDPNCEVNATIVYRGDNGNIIASRTKTLPPKGSVVDIIKADNKNFSDDNGSVEVFHDGNVGDVVGEVVSVKPKASQTFQWSLVQKRDYGRGALDSGECLIINK